MNIPALTRQGSKTILTVDGKPFVALAGEIHNSDYTSPEYMEQIYRIADELGMNTLLVPMSWDLVEPVEGCFDFSLARELLQQARRWGKKLSFLWFGSWKNAECMYAPEWVKRDLKRFPRAQIEKGKNKAGRRISESIPFKVPYTTLSALGEQTMEADAKAFAAFMAFLRQEDSEFSTVIAVQVENETGLLGAAREQSDLADELFAGPVPQDFADYLRAHTDTMVPDVKAAVEAGAPAGSWAEVFGPAAEELFTAYYTARFVEHVAARGKAEYPLPMTANCWQDKGGKPGSYPTGGPVSRVHEVWQFCAPSIDILCPDIYVPTFLQLCDEFTRRGGPLFIPECATHSYCAPRLVYTVGHHHAICYSPFGFDDIGKPFTAIQGFLFGVDVNDPALKTPQSYQEYGATAHLLQGLLPRIAPALGTADLDAACGEAGDSGVMTLGEVQVAAAFQSPLQPRRDGSLLAVRTGEDELFLLGNACSLTLQSANPEKPNLDLLRVEEGSFAPDGTWVRGRILNGDETAHMGFDTPGALKVKYFLYD